MFVIKKLRIQNFSVLEVKVLREERKEERRLELKLKGAVIQKGGERKGKVQGNSAGGPGLCSGQRGCWLDEAACGTVRTIASQRRQGRVDQGRVPPMPHLRQTQR